MKTKKQAESSQTTKLLTNGVNGKPTPEEVAVFAYLIWEQQGSTNGHDVEDWLQAERQLEAMRREESVAA
jgi:hypothetical protein